MKEKVLLVYPGNEALAERILSRNSFEKAEFVSRSFPDGETYFRLLTDVKGKEVIILCSLDKPNEKSLILFFMAKIVREQGASSVKLIAPYLAYMRQDKAFKQGEGLMAKHFATFLSSCFDSLTTVDPHLHRITSLKKIYNLSITTIHSASLIASWIQTNIPGAFLIGPDDESKQWVSEVAERCGCEYIIAKKERTGEKRVKLTLPDLSAYKSLTPVVIDDIISTGSTMKEVLFRLKEAEMSTPVCIGVHAVFAGEAYMELFRAGAVQVITCNTISHPSNLIDISDFLRI
jgi:ribose-phosphate pyrophosphokinase